MASLNLIDEIKEVEKRIQTPEAMLGKGVMMPFNNANSGARKIMFGVHLEQRLPLLQAEPPLIQTGYETQFGEYSSSFITLDNNLTMVARISKFSFDPYNHYFAILKSEDDKYLDVIERVEYKHISENYGYILDNSQIDFISPSDYISKGTVIQKSTSFDKYNNRMDGINLNCCYMNIETTMEDGIVLSESAAKRLSSPLIKKVNITINDNDIPLNLYGDNNIYKIFPDIGEDCKNGILCGIRNEKKEEFLYSQSYYRLKDLMMSDKKYTLMGKVVDINVYANNPDMLITSSYNNQIKKYYDDQIRMNKEIVDIVEPFLKRGAKMSYSLQKLYYTAKKILSGQQYMDDNKIFSGVKLEITVIEKNELHVGDKLSNRYGGKGVVSDIRPDCLMPISDNGKPVDLIFNPQTATNRLNAGQLLESSINFIARRIVEYFQYDAMDVSQCVDLYLELLYGISEKLGRYAESYLNTLSDEETVNYIASICNEKGIYLSIEPMSESMDIDRLGSLYEKFNWIQLDRIKIPIKSTNGTYRYADARRPIVVAPQYIYRLKQYAEEKFSVTSLSSTNIRNENSRNKQKNNYQALFSKTPIRFGEMESGDLAHMGAELVAKILMLYSTSPQGRRCASELLTGDPFNIDIKLSLDASNRSVEMFNVYLKTMGLKLLFTRVKKELINPFVIDPFEFFDYDSGPKKPINPFTKCYDVRLDDSKILANDIERDRFIEKYPNAFIIEPFEFFDEESDEKWNTDKY